ncbi:MAG: hypothetical protein ACREUZ_18190 [Burkholderiales bacterium]
MDFNLHGIAGLRVIDAAPADLRAVTRRLGLPPHPLDHDPDITVRFVDHIPVPPTTRYLGRNDVAFTQDAFFVLQRARGEVRKVQIPFEQLGAPCEIVCERGLAGIPLLIPALNLTMLGKNFVPLHASAFIRDGIGVVVTGSARGGKTSALLAFMAAGAQYVSDDWVYISADGRRMYGLPTPITLRESHLHALPAYRARMRGRQRLRLRALALGSNSRLLRRLERHDALKVFAKAARIAEERGYVETAPAALFGAASCPLVGTPEKIFLTVGHALPTVTIERTSGRDTLDRIALSLEHEWLPLRSYYLKARFAFPTLENPLIEQVGKLELAALARAFAGKEIYVLSHPVPAPAAELFDAVSSVLE